MIGTRATSNGDAQSTPQVRRMRLKPDDVCVVLGTGGLWKWLTPEEVITIVGQSMHRMASDAADAVAAEVRRRMKDPSASDPSDELTFVVVYLAGENYVKDFDIGRASHLEGDPFVSSTLLSDAELSDARGCFEVKMPH